jgi:DUF4097 and DUF4098 domain-containing protein YvlB
MGHRNRILFRILIASLSLAVGLAAMAGIESTQTISANKLTVHNLIGEIEIESHSGSDFEVTVNIQGDDATRDNVDVVISSGSSAEMEIRFPLDESRSYVYPRISGRTSFSVDENAGWLSQLLGSKQIKVRGSGSGLEIWADITIRVPDGKKLIVDHGVGEIAAEGISGDFNLSTRSGSIEASDISGSLVLDTGSGSVRATDIDGPLVVDTGSGSVAVSHVNGPSVSIDTGSGSVKITDVDSASVMVDTGSGGVTARSIATDEMSIDTGSGSVIAELDRMGHGSFDIDTGSGSIDLQLPADASADIEADTGSGGVRLALTGAVRIRHEDDDSAELTLGGGDADVRLDAGSGSIRIKQ